MSFRPYYGPDNDGDITKTRNMRDYAARVRSICHRQHARLVIHDVFLSVL